MSQLPGHPFFGRFSLEAPSKGNLITWGGLLFSHRQLSESVRVRSVSETAIRVRGIVRTCFVGPCR